MLPILPAAALLVAGLLDQLARQEAAPRAEAERAARWVTAPLLLLLGIVALAVWAVQLPPETAVSRPFVAALGLPLGLGGLWLLSSGRKTGRRTAGKSVPLDLRLMCTGLAAYLALGLSLLFLGSSAFPQPEIAQRILAKVGPSDRVVYAGANPTVFYDFYLHGREVERSKMGSELAVDEGEVVWVITTPAEAEHLRRERAVDVSVEYLAPAEILILVGT